MTTVEIKYRDIPSYLHAGDFYRSLDNGDPDGIIEIPSDCFEWTANPTPAFSEFCQLLRITVFWILDEFPPGVLFFCTMHDISFLSKAGLNLPESVENTILPVLMTAYGSQNDIRLKDVMKLGKWEVTEHAVLRASKDSLATALAAEAGDLRLLKFLHKQGFSWHIDTCTQASKFNHLHCLKYAHENGCPWGFHVYLYASQHGHLECMQYAFDQNLEWHPKVCSLAALKGHLKCLSFAHENGCPWDSETVAGAAQEGEIECLLYALNCGCPCNERAFLLAARNGQLDSLILLSHQDVVWTKSMTYHAAQCPDAACLQFLHERGCPWDEDIPLQCAQKGFVSPLRYALEHGCPFKDGLVEAAIESNSFDCVQYLVEDQLLFMDEKVFICALCKGNFQILEYLIDQGCPYKNAVFSLGKVKVEVYKNLFTKENPEHLSCIEYAIDRGWSPDYRVVRWTAWYAVIFREFTTILSDFYFATPRAYHKMFPIGSTVVAVCLVYSLRGFLVTAAFIIFIIIWYFFVGAMIVQQPRVRAWVDDNIVKAVNRVTRKGLRVVR